MESNAVSSIVTITANNTLRHQQFKLQIADTKTGPNKEVAGPQYVFQTSGVFAFRRLRPFFGQEHSAMRAQNEPSGQDQAKNRQDWESARTTLPGNVVIRSRYLREKRSPGC